MAARKERLEFRLTAAERKRIEANAKAAGFESVGDYVRTMALTSFEEAKEEPAIATCTHSEVKDLSNGRTKINVGECAGCGAIVKLNPDLPMTASFPNPVDTVPAAIVPEIEEAKLRDDEAQKAFVLRRTQQLVGQGRTTPVARREAEAERRARAS